MNFNWPKVNVVQSRQCKLRISGIPIRRRSRSELYRLAGRAAAELPAWIVTGRGAPPASSERSACPSWRRTCTRPARSRRVGSASAGYGSPPDSEPPDHGSADPGSATGRRPIVRTADFRPARPRSGDNRRKIAEKAAEGNPTELVRTNNCKLRRKKSRGFPPSTNYRIAPLTRLVYGLG